VAVEDADLAIDRASSAAITIRVESDSLNKVFVAVLEVEVEGRLLFVGRRGDGSG
jgi:ACT domain-containing protein